MSTVIVAGSTATLTYIPDLQANNIPTVELYDQNGDQQTLQNSVVDSSELSDLTKFALTLEDTETAVLLGACSVVWTWYYTDENGTNTVRDTEVLTVVSEAASVPALTVGTNTYVTMDEAETYMDARLGSDIWYSSSDGDKARALRQAARSLDALPLRGEIYDLEQTMAFPRMYWSAYRKRTTLTDQDERYSEITRYAGYVGDGTVPQRVKDAQCEEALELLIGGGEETRQTLMRQGVIRVSFSSFSETYSNAAVSRAKTGLASATAMALMQPLIAKSVSVQ